MSAATRSPASGSATTIRRSEAGARRRAALLPPDARAASAARAVVRAAGARWGVGRVAELAAGRVSELAANAARHAQWGQATAGGAGARPQQRAADGGRADRLL
jgi:hypothetical protein